MEIVYVPDANIAAMANALTRLGGAFCLEQTLVRSQRAKAALRCVEHGIRDLKRIDCQTTVRANRSFLNLVREEANFLSTLTESEQVREGAEEIARHLAPSFLDTCRRERT